MYQANEQENITSQWITSLAISVVCCAALFLVFAGYIMDLHEKTAMTSVRLEFLQERQNQMSAEMDMLRRYVPVMMPAAAGRQPLVSNGVVPAGPAQMPTQPNVSNQSDNAPAPVAPAAAQPNNAPAAPDAAQPNNGPVPPPPMAKPIPAPLPVPIPGKTPKPTQGKTPLTKK
jgi:hypothetical protein